MTPVSEKHEEIKCAVENLFATNPDWVKFYREVMGLHGLVRRAFPTLEEMAEFEQTETYRQIHRMVAELRKKAPPEDLEQEETKVITVRIPKSMHEALRIEAYEHHTSMNKLCISKLLQFIDAENVPAAIRRQEAARRTRTRNLIYNPRFLPPKACGQTNSKEEKVGSRSISRVLSAARLDGAMIISLGNRLLDSSSSLPGSRWRAGPTRWAAASGNAASHQPMLPV